LVEDTVNTEHDMNYRDRDRLVPAGLALLAATVSLVATALMTSGTAHISSIVVLGFLAPTVAIVTSVVERRRVARRVTVLEADLQSEQESEQRLNRLFARFTDELRAPLTAVYGLSRHLEDVGIEDVAEAENLIEIISRDATEIVRTVENTAAAAQIDAGTYRPRLVVLELDHHVTRMIDSIGRTPLEISVDARAVTVWCDPAAIRLVLLNVLHTAADGGAGIARIDVDERNGLGILSITDDRHRGHVPDSTAGDLLDTEDTLSRSIVPALVASQGGTMSSARTLGWSNTVIRIPIATPAQLSASDGATSATDASRIV
jgi:signal transduction histidine kinase